jgi:DNA-binding GntR family transcriptional regulator
VSTERLDRLITELWQAAERYIRVVYGETDALREHSAYERHLPLLEAARTRNAATMRKALTAHLRSNERELSGKLETILDTGAE